MKKLFKNKKILIPSVVVLILLLTLVLVFVLKQSSPKENIDTIPDTLELNYTNTKTDIYVEVVEDQIEYGDLILSSTPEVAEYLYEDLTDTTKVHLINNNANPSLYTDVRLMLTELNANFVEENPHEKEILEEE